MAAVLGTSVRPLHKLGFLPAWRCGRGLAWKQTLPFCLTFSCRNRVLCVKLMFPWSQPALPLMNPEWLCGGAGLSPELPSEAEVGLEGGCGALVSTSGVMASSYRGGTVLCPVPILLFLGNCVLSAYFKYSSPPGLPSRHLDLNFAGLGCQSLATMRPGPVCSVFVSRSAPPLPSPLVSICSVWCLRAGGVRGVVCRDNSELIL